MTQLVFKCLCFLSICCDALSGDLPGGDLKIFRGANEKELVYRGKKLSGLWNKKYGIFAVEQGGERLIGTIGKTNQLASMLPFGSDSYHIVVEPGVDAALICILGEWQMVLRKPASL